MNAHEFVKDYRTDELDRFHGYIRHHEKITKGYTILPYPLLQSTKFTVADKVLACWWPEIDSDINDVGFNHIHLFLSHFIGRILWCQVPSLIFKLLEHMRPLIGTSSNCMCTSGTSSLH